MYIHIGEDILVKAKDIITILDKDSVNSSNMIEEFLKSREKTTINLAKKTFKSIVVTLDKVYLSPLASVTLKKRSSHLTIKDL